MHQVTMCCSSHYALYSPVCVCVHSCTSSIKYYDEQHCQTMMCAKDCLNPSVGSDDPWRMSYFGVVWLMPPIFMTFNFTIQSTPAHLLSQSSPKHRKVYTNM